MATVVTRDDILNGLRTLGVRPSMMLEVHCAMSSFGTVQGGADAVICALMDAVGPEGAIVMPSLRLSDRLPLDEEDRALGLTLKLRILPQDAPRSGMGIVADTFRARPDVRTGEGLFGVSAWGRDAGLHSRGFQNLIDSGGWALMLGVDIYRLTAMHYVESALPPQITDIFRPSGEARRKYPEDQWFIEAGEPPVKAWYKIQDRAYELGLIREGLIGHCRCMFFPVKEVIEIYRQALETDALRLYGL